MLDQDAAKKALQVFCDPEYVDYLGDVADNQEAIDRAIEGWANCLYDCASLVVPLSTTADAAKAAFEAAAEGMHLSGAVFQAAVTEFASVLGGGMTGAGFAAVPPPALYLPLNAETTHEGMCNEMATLLVAWFQTGTATRLVPPFDTVNWS